ncbi:hypothetical protein AOLI_G00111680 [Acnodon oligacanthus]
MTSSTKSRPFSPSSERYIVNQIHNSFAGSACDYPSNPTGSVEMETGQLPESIAETDTIACLDGEGEGDIHMPTEDDIEKSFRINQDGSMTVEMKVRLTIKEEETIHWTTTLSRSSVPSQMKTKSHPDLGATIPDNIPPEVDPVASEVIENCPEELAFLLDSPEEMEAGRAKPITGEKEPLHSLPSSPGWRKVQQKQSVGSTMKVTETEIQENVLGSYAYMEETSNGEMKQEHCMVRQCRSRPVPKPRSNLPSELNATTSQPQSDTYKSAEILQLQDNGEAVHETVLHIYEQQTCQENFFANTQLCIQGMGTYSSAGGRPPSSDTVFPASSEKTIRSSSEDLESEPRVSSTYGSLMRQQVFQSDLYALHQKNISQEIRIFNEYVNLWLQKSEPDRQQVPSTHTELQESTTFLTPKELQSSPEVGEITFMTLKDGLANLNTCRQAQDNLSCSEALLMLQSLKEMATIEDAEKLRASLNALQNSTSVQLLQSWRGFQELSNISRSHGATSGSSRSGSCSEEEAIQGLMEDLGVPDRVREELTALCTQEEESIRGNQVDGLEKQSESLPEVKMNGFMESFLREKTISLPNSVLEDVNIYVKAVIENAVQEHLDDCSISDVSVAHLLVSAEKEIKMATDKHEAEFSQRKRSKQADCVLDFDIDKNMSSHESALEEEQKITEERVAELIRTEDRGVVAGQQEINAKPQKEKEVMDERVVFEDCKAKTNDIMEEVLDCHERRESAKNVVDTREIDEDRDTEKNPKSSKSPTSSENKLTTSEEEKSSSEEEEDSCEEELMTFSEDQVSDKEENLGSDQKYAMTVILSQHQNEGQVSQTESQLHSKTDCEETLFREPEMQATLLAIHVESDVKEDTIKPETDQQHVVYEEKIIYSGDEQVILEEPECYTIYQEHFEEEKAYGPEKAEEHEENTTHFTEKKKTSVAELISNIESVAQKVSDISKKPVDRFLTHTDVPDISDTDKLDNVSQMSSEQDEVAKFIKYPSKVQTQNKSDGEKHSPNEPSKKIRTTKQSHMDLTSEPLSSSLAFSYDSRSSSLAQDPEESIQANRVKSIREMFLAKSNTTTRKEHRRQHSPNSDMSDYQAEFSDSAGNQSQTSPETSSGEDDTNRLAIAKGFVRRTIERLYGRGHSNSTGPDDRRPLSASRGKQREGLGRTNVTTLASIHEARTQGKTDLSYFNATSSVDAFNESTHCVTLNAQVGPEDAVLIDKGCWLLCENQLIRESSPELESQSTVEKNTTILADSEQDAMKEDVPYSLFSPASPNRTLSSTELEELPRSLRAKFTYFNLPNASDSELEPEGLNSDTPSKREAKVSPVTQSPKSWAEKDSILPAFNPPVIKRADNKVHPLLEALTPPVVTQPVRGQNAQTEVARRSTEPDVLEMLFIFCGQHCPIL